jgi:hypothetical protein
MDKEFSFFGVFLVCRAPVEWTKPPGAVTPITQEHCARRRFSVSAKTLGVRHQAQQEVLPNPPITDPPQIGPGLALEVPDWVV